MHDPSTVIEAGGTFDVYATGNGLPAFASDAGWTWHRTGSVMRAVTTQANQPRLMQLAARIAF
jgi:hypothetical protein